MLFPLRIGATFDDVSERMERAGAKLTRLESCTFPSRPEARLATWTVGGEPFARYRYEPDIELRWLAVDRTDLLDEDPTTWELFDDWEALETALFSDDWGRVFRAAAAFRVAAENREPVDGETKLAAALSAGENSAQAAASQLALIATEASVEAIETALESAKKVETRVDLRRALNRVEMTSFTRR